jgi:hypothetical protein
MNEISIALQSISTWVVTSTGILTAIIAFLVKNKISLMPSRAVPDHNFLEKASTINDENINEYIKKMLVTEYFNAQYGVSVSYEKMDAILKSKNPMGLIEVHRRYRNLTIVKDGKIEGIGMLSGWKKMIFPVALMIIMIANSILGMTIPLWASYYNKFSLASIGPVLAFFIIGSSIALFIWPFIYSLNELTNIFDCRAKLKSAYAD